MRTGAGMSGDIPAPHFMADYGPQLAADLWPFLPLLPHDAPGNSPGKAPGFWSGRRWLPYTGWRSIGVPNAQQVARWCTSPPTGIGIACGVPCGQDGTVFLAAIDLDITDQAVA